MKREVQRGSPKTSGSYISFEDAPAFCKHFSIDLPPIRHLLMSQSEPTTASPNEYLPDNMQVAINTGENIDGAYGNASQTDKDFEMPSPRDPHQSFNLNASQHSKYTEASYQNGSYLAPANRSYLQLLDQQE